MVPPGSGQILSEIETMCGRYTLTTPAELIQEHFDLEKVPEVGPRFNIAPSQETLIVGSRADGSRGAGLASWGLALPRDSTARGREGGRPRTFINARIETVSERPAFSSSFARRRCLVPADGFYEWQQLDDGKQPVFFSLSSRRLFAFAGIWNPAASEEEPPTFAILTTSPNAAVEPIHDRMPVILEPGIYGDWLAQRPLDDRLRERAARSVAGTEIQQWPVSRFVNNPANDSPECLEPIPVDPTSP